MILIGTTADNRTIIKPINDVHEYVDLVLSNDFIDDHLVINDDTNHQHVDTIQRLFVCDHLSAYNLTPVQYQFVKDLFELA
jgi:hypothetical protein